MIVISLFDSNSNRINENYSEYDHKYVFKASKKEKHKSNKNKREFFDWLDIIATALITVVLLFTFVFRVATIDGESMLNTFHNGEKVIISNLGYTPKRGDVVVISRNYNNEPNKIDHDSQPIIKRIIATEGCTVRIDFDNGIVYVNEEALDEPYTATPTNNLVDLEQSEKLKSGVVVPKNCIFVLGDNRNNSLDSRSSTIGNNGNGMIDREYILGKVYFRIFPLSKIGGVR